MRKILISPFFGKLPPWIEEYKRNCEALKRYGWDFFIFDDLDLFTQLIKDKLGINPNIQEGTCKASDFRPALGLILEDQLRGYDFWGHTDLDCVYGRLDKFISSPFLVTCDIYSNDIGHMCGPMSLYRNTDKINHLFQEYPNWQKLMEDPTHHAFDEKGMSQVIRHHPELRVLYRHWEGKNPNIISRLHYENGSLFDGKDEIMYFHFNRLKPKTWPL